MPTLPTPPCFVVCSKGHSIYMEDAVQTRKRVSRLAVVDGVDSDSVVFDSEGLRWAFRFEGQRLSVLAKLLAHIVYNPVDEVTVSWSYLCEYSLKELREAYLDAVDHDDDILTQFVERETLVKRIQQCRSFQDLVETWQWMITDHD